jgi:hypothetical protein
MVEVVVVVKSIVMISFRRKLEARSQETDHQKILRKDICQVNVLSCQEMLSFAFLFFRDSRRVDL